MRLTHEDTTAKLLDDINDRLSRVEAEQETDDQPIQIREVTETELSSDSTATSVDTDPGWQWGTSSWGFDVWN